MSKRRLPAEWEKQAAVLLSFPRPDGDYGAFAEAAARQHLNLCATICQVCPVILVASDLAFFKAVYEELASPSAGNENGSALYRNGRADLSITQFGHPLFVIELAGDDVWARDFGPISVIEDQEIKMIDYVFNGWGGKYNAELDNTVTSRLINAGIIKPATFQQSKLVLEGGSIESDGAGTVMSTRKCLLHPGRNPGLSEAEILTILRRDLGAEQVLMLSSGHLENDDTDAHIDTIARFAPGGRIVYQGCQDPQDVHYADFQRMAKELAAFADTSGKAYQLYELPWPPPTYSREDGRRLPASYANFLVINGMVICPAIHKKSDPEAKAVLERAFPDHLVKFVAADYLLEQHGSVHCLTMNIPLTQDSRVVPII